MDINVNYHGIILELDCDYEHAEQGDYNNPSHPESYSINTISFEGVDITEILDIATNSNIFEELEELIKQQ